MHRISRNAPNRPISIRLLALLVSKVDELRGCPHWAYSAGHFSRPAPERRRQHAFTPSSLPSGGSSQADTRTVRQPSRPVSPVPYPFSPHRCRHLPAAVGIERPAARAVGQHGEQGAVPPHVHPDRGNRVRVDRPAPGQRADSRGWTTSRLPAGLPVRIGTPREPASDRVSLMITLRPTVLE